MSNKLKLSLLTAVALLTCGCGSQITSVYDASKDAVTCQRREMGDIVETWSEHGYVCHPNPENRVKP